MKLSLTFIKDNFLFILGGIPVAFEIVIVSLACSFVLGFILAVLRRKKIPVVDQLIQVFVSFMRGTPIVVQIFIVYSGAPRVLNILVHAMGLSIDVFSVNAIFYAYLVFGLNTSAYMCEVFRSALASVSVDQMEASVAMGLTPMQGYWRIVLPQAMVSALPNICNNTLKLMKNTSLVYVMSIMDITGRAKYAAGNGYNYIEAYSLIFIIYIALCITIEKLFFVFEEKLKIYKRR